MNSTPTTQASTFSLVFLQYAYLIRALFAGCLLPLSFAPFHFPGLAILGVALLFAELLHTKTWFESMLTGFVFGAGYMGFGVSWVYVSIHLYGHLSPVLSLIITCVFIMYLACFFALLAGLFYILKTKARSIFMQGLIFAAVWCLSEWLRGCCFSGFPWLLLGFGQIDTPLGYALPLVGIYGVGFWLALIACVLVVATHGKRLSVPWIVIFIAMIMAPYGLRWISWTRPVDAPLSVGVIQANLSMRDKWDEALFWHLLEYYQQRIDTLLSKHAVIVMPESAIPVPASYLKDWFDELHVRAVKANSTILLGIPQPTSQEETYFYNTIASLGLGFGSYAKQHLVPFGEYTPKPFQKLMQWLNIQETAMKSGAADQSPMIVQHHPIAALICYELAYPELLRQQLPEARWIVSISDDGWFGHSLAMYQQVQMAQALAKQTGRYHIIANNDGLSSIIDHHGTITKSLPAFTSSTLEGHVVPRSGRTPWVIWGDMPIFALSLLIALIALFSKRRYPN